ncbi:MAG: hypothetical protein JM58_09260 [Peptococcaceae bacterium BICA1-8]|nr:MAG: hypothetical protein JM58_09260 [Peptococcaceae bacterium BICA1-8]
MFNEVAEQTLILAGMEEQFGAFNQCLEDYDNRYIRIIKPQEKGPERAMGQNGIHYIQLALFRSRTLFEGSISSMNHKNALVATLSTRAHLEVTGGLGYFYKKLNNFYNGIITYEQLDEALRKLTLGARIKELDKAPDPISVMSLIDATDDYFKNKIPEKVSMFRESYDFLSEFCHPNCYGVAMGCDINSVGIIRYSKSAKMTEKDLIFVHFLLMSSHAFFNFNDKVFELLSKNEELQIFIK